MICMSSLMKKTNDVLVLEIPKANLNVIAFPGKSLAFLDIPCFQRPPEVPRGRERECS